MSRDRIKIHDVMHDAVEFDQSRVERRIESMLTDDRVEGVRIAKGYRNSPIFIHVDESSNLSVDSIMRVCRTAVRTFANHVDGVDVEECVHAKNVRLQEGA